MSGGKGGDLRYVVAKREIEYIDVYSIHIGEKIG